MHNSHKMIFLHLIFLFWSFHIIQAQITCPNGVVAYEKSSATSVRIDSTPDRTIEIASEDVPTTKCQSLCNATPSCTSFTVEYTDRTCKLFSATLPKSRLLSRPDTAFFEKICLPDVSQDRFRTMCNSKLWATERVTEGSFSGPVVRQEQNVPSRSVCTRLCLSETTFDCASAVYDSIARTCALSTEDRRTQPALFDRNSRSTEYIENQCISDLRDCQFLPENNHKVVSVDYVTITRNDEQCRDDCNRNTAIICRAYSYELAKNNCFLSSDDSISLQGIDLPIEEGFRYGERRCRHGGSRFLSGAISNQPTPITLPTSPYSNFNPQLNPGSRPDGFQNFYNLPSRTPYGGFVSSNFGTAGGLQPQNPAQTSPFQPSFGYIPNAGDPYGIGQSGRQVPFNGAGFNINSNNPFLINQGYPGYSGSLPTANTGYNAFASPDRCTYEKITGFAVTADPQGPIPINAFRRGITDQCTMWCRLQGPARCPAFTVDYSRSQCTVLSRPVDFSLVPGAAQGHSYFEQICFPNNYRSCEGKLWAFERIPRSELRGFDDRVLPSVRNLRECEEACLKETQFLCLSAEYDNARGECHLSRENRLSRAFAFQQSPNVEYVENQCVPPPNTFSNCNLLRQEGQTVLYADAALPQIYSEEECRRLCQNSQNFTCNAASYHRTTSECLLSSSTTTIVFPDAILLYTSCLQPMLVSSTSTGQQPFIPNSANNPFSTAVSGFGLNPTTPFYTNQFTGSYNPATTNLQPPFTTQSFGFGYQPQNPQLFGVQSNFGGIQPFSNQFPNTGYSTPGSTLGAQVPGQFPITGQMPGQLPTSGQLPGTGQYPTLGYLPQPGQEAGAGTITQTGRQYPGSVGFPGSSGQFPGYVQQFPATTGQFPGSGQQFPITTGQFPGPGQQFHITTGQLPAPSQQFPTPTGQFQGTTGQTEFTGQRSRQVGRPYSSENPSLFHSNYPDIMFHSTPMRPIFVRTSPLRRETRRHESLIHSKTKSENSENVTTSSPRES